MADTYNKETRSRVMRQVKSNQNKSTEIKLINFFRSNKIIGWRRKVKLFGNPDFVFPSKKIAVFVDGCFWHGHNCRNTTPKANQEYWTNKISRNKKRDKLVSRVLRSKKWKVLRIWECCLTDKKLKILFKNN